MAVPEIPMELNAETIQVIAEQFPNDSTLNIYMHQVAHPMRELPPAQATAYIDNELLWMPERLRNLWRAWNKSTFSVLVDDSSIPKNRFYAVAWLCGASWGQIANMFDITRATVSTATNRLLPPKGRQMLRLTSHIISNEQLSAVKEAYLKLCKHEDAEIVMFMRFGNIYEVATKVYKLAQEEFADEPLPDAMASEEVIVDNPMHNVPTGVDPYDPRTWKDT